MAVETSLTDLTRRFKAIRALRPSPTTADLKQNSSPQKIVAVSISG
jgi:hypothetical protein